MAAGQIAESFEIGFIVRALAHQLAFGKCKPTLQVNAFVELALQGCDLLFCIAKLIAGGIGAALLL